MAPRFVWVDVGPLFVWVDMATGLTMGASASPHATPLFGRVQPALLGLSALIFWPAFCDPGP